MNISKEEIWNAVKEEVYNLESYQKLEVYWNEETQELWSIPVKLYFQEVIVKEGNKFIISLPSLWGFWNQAHLDLEDIILSLGEEKNLRMQENEEEFKDFLFKEYGKDFFEVDILAIK